MIRDSDMMHMRATNSSYSMYGRPIENWISQGRDYYMSPSHFSTTSSSSSAIHESASPFHPSYVSTPETHHGRSYDRSYARIGWNHEINFSQTQFSGETTERRYSQELGQSPQPAFLYQGYYGHNLYDTYRAGAATSQKYLYTGYHSKAESSTLSHEFNSHVKEKIRVAKRHLRPIKGGAPFVTCYYCLKVLQLPQDSIVSKKKLFLLRCGSCSGVLEFLLRDKTHTVVPHKPCVLESVPRHGSDSPVNDLDLALVGNGSENGDATSCSVNDDGGGYISRGSSINGDLACLKQSNELPVNTDSENFSLEGTIETPELYLKQAAYESEVLREPLGWNELVGEKPGVHLGKPQNDDDKPREASDYDKPREATKLDETVEDRLGDPLKLLLVDKRNGETLKPSETTRNDEADESLEESGTKSENLSAKPEAEKFIKPEDKSAFKLEECIKENENSSEELEWEETEGEKPEFHLGEYKNESENSSEELEWEETEGEKPEFHFGEYKNEREFHMDVYRFERENSCQKHEAGETMEEGPVFHSKHNRSESEESSEKLELGETIEMEEFSNERESPSVKLEVNEIPEEKHMSHLEEFVNEFETSTDKLAPGETKEERPVFHSTNIRSENENLGEKLELREAIKEKPAFQFGEFINNCETLSEKPEPGETMQERPVSHSKHIRSESENSSENLELGETLDEIPVSYVKEFIYDHETSSDLLEPGETVEEQTGVSFGGDCYTPGSLSVGSESFLPNA